ncbi:hypothetical protein [Mesorhizobium sp. Z1-4]|uniref:hypothetical protein n=1 Tax=Mesorhizobium sp. Z1-4 TaxID=2448478 RepID=UPI000FDBE59D|nr:hypothetical protein [Mesorhizobium sp. Z1-4]
MRFLAAGLFACALAPALAGCSTSETMHHEGVTSYAGDAMRANTVLQMVDPWQYGVQDTDLETPAERPWRKAASADTGGGDTSGDTKP